MELKEYARILLKRGWIIVLVAVIAAGSAAVFSELQRPVYRSTVKLAVRPARPSDYGQSLALKNILMAFGDELKTPKIAQQVNDRLQLDLPASDLLSKVAVDADEARFNLRLSVKDYDPVIAQQIAQTWAEVFVYQRETLNNELDQRDRILVSILEDAEYGAKFSPKTKINAAAGGVLGGLLGLLLVFSLEYMEAGIIREPADVERHIGVPVLGTIPTVPKKEGLPAGEGQQWWRIWQRA